MANKALITGITGQDGSYLAELLLEKGYDVHGMVRIIAVEDTKNIKHLLKNENLTLHYGDLNDTASIDSLVKKVMPDEVYNLGALTHVGLSFQFPEQHLEATAGGPLRLLEALRKYCPPAKFYQASTSELFGNAEEVPQWELTEMQPRSPYAIAKLYAYMTTKMYREAYGMFAVNGILFNHESPRRGPDFVTQKIVHKMVDIWQRKNGVLELGNMDAKRDWGFAGDYVKGMWAMLQHDTPSDYVLATGETHTVREFVEEVAKVLMIDLIWEGEGLNEVGRDSRTGEILVKINPEFYRPAEVNLLCGEAGKAHEWLGWKPEVNFYDLVGLMVQGALKGGAN
jgi:GDPmannose 4,6-dehydratase